MKIEPELPGFLPKLRIRLNCPYCHTFTKITIDTWTSHGTFHNQKLKNIGAIYYCESCLEPIFITWQVADGYKNSHGPIVNSAELMHIALPKSDMSFVPDEVKTEYHEALKSYGIGCFNAFAAMCRRTIQQICMQKEIRGSDRVKKQAEKLKEELADTEMSEIIDAVIVAGHDGTHPHLPEVDEDRAQKLLALMNDIIDQIYNRPGRLADAKKSRQEKINQTKIPPVS